MSFITKSMSKLFSLKQSKTKKIKKRPPKIKTTIIDDFNIEHPTPFENDNILEFESVYDDNNYISEKNLIKMLKNNNNYKLTSNQNEKLKHFIKEQYFLKQIPDKDLTLYKKIFPDFMSELEQKNIPIQRHSKIYKPYNRKVHNSKYNKKPKSKTGKKKPKSKTGKKKIQISVIIIYHLYNNLILYLVK